MQNQREPTWKKIKQTFSGTEKTYMNKGPTFSSLSQSIRIEFENETTDLNSPNHRAPAHRTNKQQNTSLM